MTGEERKRILAVLVEQGLTPAAAKEQVARLVGSEDEVIEIDQKGRRKRVPPGRYAD